MASRRIFAGTRTGSRWWGSRRLSRSVPRFIPFGAALLGRLRLAAALAVATLLKVSLEAVAKTFVQRDRPAETLPEVILRGKATATG